MDVVIQKVCAKDGLGSGGLLVLERQTFSFDLSQIFHVYYEHTF